MQHLIHLPLFAFFAVALLVGPVFADAQRYDGQTADGDYTVETPAQLLALGDAAQDFSFSNSTFTLGADIDLSGSVWTPIGNNSAPFTGVFHGNGRKITGLSIDSDGDYARHDIEYLMWLHEGNIAAIRNFP